MTPDTAQIHFPTEYEQELETWLRRRFGILCYVYLALAGIGLLVEIAAAFTAMNRVPSAAVWIGLGINGVGASLLSLAVIARALFVQQPQLQTRDEVLRAAFRLILSLGAISLISQLIKGWLAAGNAGDVYAAFFIWHFTACLVLPWTSRESLRPLIPLIVAFDVILFIISFPAGIARVVFHVIFNPGILIPGLAICAWRMSRHTDDFRSRMVGKQFMTMRQEFARARSVHESVFPQPYDDGHVRFDFTYSPMRELGGDFVHLHVAADGLVHVTLIDVTGHGLSAALTVNRLYGELERIRAESPRAEPGEVIALLNRYIYLTMSRHQIYATAVCLSIDPYESRVRWCSAGHPPGMLLGANGAVTRLPSTVMMLGILPDEAFEPNQQSSELSPGDALMIYTDGVIESRNRRGEQFGLTRLEECLNRQPAPGHWPDHIASLVGRHAAGRSEDDVLIASLTFQAPRREPAIVKSGMMMA